MEATFLFFTSKHSPTNSQGKRTTEVTLDNKTKGSRSDVPMWLARLIRLENIIDIMGFESNLYEKVDQHHASSQ